MWAREENSRCWRLELLADPQVDLGTFQRPLPLWFRALRTRTESVRLRGDRRITVRELRSHGSTGLCDHGARGAVRLMRVWAVERGSRWPWRLPHGHPASLLVAPGPHLLLLEQQQAATTKQKEPLLEAVSQQARWFLSTPQEPHFWALPPDTWIQMGSTRLGGGQS